MKTTTLTVSNNKFNKYELFKLRQATAAIAENIGFTTASSSAISSLSFLLRTYFEQLCRDSINTAVDAGRYEMSLEDVSQVFHENGISLTELNDYMHQVAPFVSAEELPVFPVTETALTTTTSAIELDENSERKDAETRTGSGMENDSRKEPNNKQLLNTSGLRSAGRSAALFQRTFPNFAGSFARDFGLTVRKIEPPVENVLIEQQLARFTSICETSHTIFQRDRVVAQPFHAIAVISEEQERLLKKKKKKEKRDKEKADEEKLKEGKRKKHKDKSAEGEEGNRGETPIIITSPTPEPIPKLKIRFGPGPSSTPTEDKQSSPIRPTSAIGDVCSVSPPDKISSTKSSSNEKTVGEIAEKVPPLKIGLKSTNIGMKPVQQRDKTEIIQQQDEQIKVKNNSNTVDGIAELLAQQKQQQEKRVKPPTAVVPSPSPPPQLEPQPVTTLTSDKIPKSAALEEMVKKKNRKQKDPTSSAPLPPLSVQPIATVPLPPIQMEEIEEKNIKINRKRKTPSPLDKEKEAVKMRTEGKSEAKPPTKSISKPLAPTPKVPSKTKHQMPAQTPQRLPSASLARENMFPKDDEKKQKSEKKKPTSVNKTLAISADRKAAPITMTSSGRNVKPSKKQETVEVERSKEKVERKSSVVLKIPSKSKLVPKTPKTSKSSLFCLTDSAAKVQAIAKAVEEIAAAQSFSSSIADDKNSPPPAAMVENDGAEGDEEEDIWICPSCSVAYVEGQEMVACDVCDRWYHC